MEKLIISSRYWEILVEVGNDWGEPSYSEVKRFSTREELNKCLEDLNYYSIPLGVREVVEYNIVYEYEERDYE